MFDAGASQLCAAGNLAEWETTRHAWRQAIDVMESAWRLRALTSVRSIRQALPPPGSLVTDDTQTLVEEVDTFRSACVEGGAIADRPEGEDVCGPLFDQSKPPLAAVRRALARRGYGYFDQTAVTGDLTAVTAVAQPTADAHARAVFFFRGDRLLGTDLRHGSRPHFDVNICSLARGRAETSYLVGMGNTAPDPACPRGPRVVHVRWRITATAVHPLDPIPGSCA